MSVILPIRIVGRAASGDLNNIKTAGDYVQGRNADAKLELNYPIQKAGLLEVIGTSAHIVQRYTAYDNSAAYRRYCYMGTWTSWDT